MKFYNIRLNARLFLFFALYPYFVHAQYLPNVIPPSPQTQELNKYIDFPVDLSTGVPEISIPLYTIKTKGVDIPITLNYHASGIKHGQDDGDVGVGWSLSYNYRVSRTIHGLPDSDQIEMNPSLYQSKIQQYENNLTFPPFDSPITSGDNIVLYQFLERDKFLRRFLPSYIDNQFSLPPLTTSLLDGEYDRFNYSLPSGSGSFIITNRINHTIQEINPSFNKFSYIEGAALNNVASGIIGFEVKDDNQNRYSFGEMIDKLGKRVMETNNSPMDITNVTAWALTDIKTKYDEHIKFHYRTKDITSKYKKQLSINITDPVGYINPPGTWANLVNDEFTNANYSIFALTDIVAVNEIIEIVEAFSSSDINRVLKITIKNKETNEIIKNIDFQYVTRSIFPHSYTFLDYIDVTGKDGIGTQTYRFEYYDDDDYAPNFITNSSIVPDQWGFNKLVVGSFRLLHQEFSANHIRPNGDLASTNRITGNMGQYYSGYLTPRDVNENPELFSLKKVIYPTGGYTTYQYEPNREGSQSGSYLGGIRIKSIGHFEGRNNDYNSPILNFKREYSYEGGYNRYQIDDNSFKKEYPIMAESPIHGHMSLRGIKYSSTAFSDLESSVANTYHTRVSEIVSSQVGFNGRLNYQFELLPGNNSDLSLFRVEMNDPGGYMNHYYNGPRYLLNYSYRNKPNLLKKETRSNNNALLRKETWSYTTDLLGEYVGMKVIPYAHIADFSEYYPYYYAYISSVFNHGLYTVQTGKSLLYNKTEMVYSSADSLKTETLYSYNSKNQVIKEKAVDSKNQVIEKSMVYPADTPNDQNSIRMLQINDVNKVLEETVKIDGIIVSQVKNQYYELPGEIFVPDKVRRYNTDMQVQEDGIVFHKYDAKGNVHSLSRANDVVINYVWSYGKRFPIAEIKGPDYQAIQTLLGGSSVIDNFSNLTNPSKAQIDSFLTPIRTAINGGTLKDVEISSFSYDPLLGIKSQTDSSGKSVYYEYDSFGRLDVVKDDNGAIEKKMDYNYRNQ
ncbi:hypothetical protein [Sphingobacterium faecium]|uniref:hypothetical protein n=1 Tax=Sphingobacterium faecium TaxID=34087 RepID=UPI00320886A5